MNLFQILWMILVGFLAGFIARGLLPGSDTMGFWMTCLIGVVGSFVGGFIGSAIWKPKDGAKFHPAGFLMSIVGAMVLLLVRRFVMH